VTTTNEHKKNNMNTHALSDSDDNDENYRALGWLGEVETRKSLWNDED
jgi:hypothetical protein